MHSVINENKKMNMKFRILIIYFSIFIFHISYSQNNPPPWQWARSPMEEGIQGQSPNVYGLTLDHAGNIYAAGGFFSQLLIFGTDTLLTDRDYGSTFIVKYDSIGGLLWAKADKYRSNSQSLATGTVTDSSNNVYISGFYLNTTVFDADTLFIPPNAFDNTYLIKLDSRGNVIWARYPSGNFQINENYGDSPNSMTIDKNNNICILGDYSNSFLIFGNDTIVNQPNGGNCFIVKYDNSGNLLWAVNAYTSGSASPGSITADNANNIYITGYFTGTLVFGKDTITNPGSSEMFLAKYNSSGNLIWVRNSKNISGLANSEAAWTQGIAVDRSCNAYITGSFQGTIAFGINSLTVGQSKSTTYLFLVKYDSSGNVIWARAAGAPAGV